MIAYRDSSVDRPNASQARAAYAAGVRAWGGYLAAVVPPGPRSSGGSNLLTAWSQADFDVLRAAGIQPIAFASGWDDAGACGALARAWRVRLMLDVEDAIRGDGSWVDAWLAASGAGLYGLCAVHRHVAPAHIVARYPDGPVPASTWDPQCQPAPAGLLGWQAQGTHADPATGLQVDAGWVDDGFVQEEPMALDPNDPIVAEIRANVQQTRSEVTLGFQTNPDGSKWEGAPNYLGDQLAALQPGTGGLTADQAAALAAIPGLVAAVERIETALKGA